MSVRPLAKGSLKSFLDRFCGFIDAELRGIEVLTPTNITITLYTQDKLRGYDWVELTLLFDSVSDARLLEASKLGFVDMSEGITLCERGFAVGSYRCTNIEQSLCYIVAPNIKYSEI